MALRGIGATSTGLSHRDSGLPCQDKVRMETVADRFVIGALADGLGSAKCSDVGAELAVNCAASIVAKQVADWPDSVPTEEQVRSLFVGALEEAHAELTSRALAQELLGVLARHGRDVEHVLLALAAEAHAIVAGHVVPARVARARDADLIEKRQRPATAHPLELRAHLLGVGRELVLARLELAEISGLRAERVELTLEVVEALLERVLLFAVRHEPV